MKKVPHTDCPFCWYDHGQSGILDHCPLCWQSRRVPQAAAVEFALMEVPQWKSWMGEIDGPNCAINKPLHALKQELRSLRRRHGLRSEKWK